VYTLLREQESTSPEELQEVREHIRLIESRFEIEAKGAGDRYDRIRVEMTADIVNRVSGFAASLELLRLEGERFTRDVDGFKLCLGHMAQEIDLRVGK
jgi:hypothetical protein